MKKKIIFVVISILIAFFVSIVVDRTLGIYLNKIGYFKAMVPNVTKIYDTKEFYTIGKTSSQGLRNEEVKIPKPKGTFRILAVGDSFTYGWGVDLNKGWVKLLESKLRVKGKTVEMINAGDPGIGLTKIRQICRAYTSQFNIDLVLVDLFGDDIYRAANDDENIPFIEQLISNIWPILSRIRSPIIFDSTWRDVNPGDTIRFSGVFKEKIKEDLKKNPTLLLHVSPEIRTDFLNGKINPGLAYQALADPDFWNYYLNPDKFAFALNSTEKRLELLKERCGKIPVIVVFIPPPELVSNYYQPFKRAYGYSIDPALSRFDIDSYLKKIVEKSKFSYISVLNKMREDGCTDCYYKYDLHFNEKGNNKFANFIAPEIQKILNRL